MIRSLRTLFLSASLLAFPASSQITSNPQVVISHVYGGGGNASAAWRNDFVVLFNRGTSNFSLTGYSVQYTSSTGTGNFGATSSLLVTLSGTLSPGQYYLVTGASSGAVGTLLPGSDASNTSLNMSATAGKVALINGTTSLGCNGSSTACSNSQLAQIVDLVGYGTGTNFFEGSAVAPSISNTSWLVRAGNGCTDTNSNSTDFSVVTSGIIPNTATALAPCGGGSTNPTGSGSANPNPILSSSSTLLTVAVTPGGSPTSTGLTVTADLSTAGGSATQTLFDNGTNGDVTAGDNVFSYSFTVPGGTSAGAKTIPFAVADSQSRSTNSSFTLNVTAPTTTLSISAIQGTTQTSPYVGQSVSTSGIVTLRKSNGFYIQTPDALVDNDPNTSEGLFVFTSSTPSANAAIGNSVQVTGTVTEFRSSSTGALDPNTITEITSPTVTVLTTGNPLPTPIVLNGSSINPANGFGQLERYEGMRVTFTSLTATSPTGGTVSEANATATSNGRFYAVPTGVARPFLEPGIAPDTALPLPGIPRFDGNLEIYEIDFNLPGDTALNVTSTSVITGVVGVLDYFPPYYVINHDPAVPASVSGILSATPVSGAGPTDFAIASFNAERFFDTVDDPSVSDVALTPTAYAGRLAKISLAIRNVLKTPDVIGLEEIENLGVLQAIATQVNNDAVAAAQPNPNYVAFLFEGNDVGGIDVGFLIKQSVTVNSVTQLGKDTTYIDPSTNTPAIVFDRPPLLADIVAKLPTSDSGINLKVLVNHLRSLNGVDTQDANGNRVRAKRAAGAENVASFLQGYQSVAGANVLTLGDFNAFEFNDGYVDVMGTIKGAPTSALNVQVASPDLVNPNFVNLMEDKLIANVNRYSYSFNGNAQVIDHILVNTNLYPRVNRVEVARNDADFPESFRADFTRPERISDHDMPVAYLTLPNEVSSKATVTKSALLFNRATGNYSGTIRVSNPTESALPGPLYVFLNGLPAGVTVVNASGTSGGSPYLTGAPSGLAAGAFVDIPVQFRLSSPATITYTTKVFAGAF